MEKEQTIADAEREIEHIEILLYHTIERLLRYRRELRRLKAIPESPPAAAGN